MQCDQPVDRGEPGRGEQGHGPHLPQVDTSSLFSIGLGCLVTQTSHFNTQDPLGSVRWHCTLQLSCYDPSLDVPHGSHLWQHLHNEGMGGGECNDVSVHDDQPSERDPTACMALVELLKEAGEEKFRMQMSISVPLIGETFQAARMEW